MPKKDKKKEKTIIVGGEHTRDVSAAELHRKADQLEKQEDAMQSHILRKRTMARAIKVISSELEIDLEQAAKLYFKDEESQAGKYRYAH